jgi:hypothetical protein
LQMRKIDLPQHRIGRIAEILPRLQSRGSTGNSMSVA